MITTRHERKAGGNVANAGRGSTAFTGAVDIVMVIRRPEGNTRPSMREIHAVSRFDETPDFLVIERTEQGYVARGSSAAVAQVEAETSLLMAAPTNEGDAVRLEDFMSQTGVQRSTAQEVIKTLVAKGQFCRVGEGKRGSPYRYYAQEIHSAETSTPNAAETIPNSREQDESK